ncbi:lysophospholipase [Spirochaetia bacterium 38H-sp]|uniref:Lysophospholipase n=1 Tax=Rarispira pelagica TaxID=3141764 RepID=A0ABU9UAS4_9SPIR
MYNYKEEVIFSENIRYFYRTWKNPKNRAIVFICHGIGEHSGNFVELGGLIADAGYMVIAPDHYGHGQSGGKKGYIPSWETFRNEIKLILSKENADGMPVILYGHSMGATIVLDYFIRNQENIGGAVVTAPALSLDGVSGIKKLLGRFMAKIKPDFQLESGLDTSYLTKDKDMMARLFSDPLAHGKATPRLMLEIEEVINYCHENANKIEKPILIMQGEKDRIVSPEATKSFFSNIKTEDKTLILVPNGMHKIEHDTEREESIEKILNWLKKHN